MAEAVVAEAAVTEAVAVEAAQLEEDEDGELPVEGATRCCSSTIVLYGVLVSITDEFK